MSLTKQTTPVCCRFHMLGLWGRAMNNWATAVAMEAHFLLSSSSNLSFSWKLSKALRTLSVFVLDPRLIVLQYNSPI